MISYIKKYNTYFNTIENIIDSLNLIEKEVLFSIKAEEVEFKLFGFNIHPINIDILYNDNKFETALLDSNYRKSDLFDTIDYETFLETPFKFFFLYDINKNDLENPNYIIIESNNNVKIYSINDNIKNFYDKLTSKTIVIIDDNIKYVYQTSTNNEWSLKSNNVNAVWLKIYRKEDFFKKLKDNIKKIKIDIS